MFTVVRWGRHGVVSVHVDENNNEEMEEKMNLNKNENENPNLDSGFKNAGFGIVEGMIALGGVVLTACLSIGLVLGGLRLGGYGLFKRAEVASLGAEVASLGVRLASEAFRRGSAEAEVSLLKREASSLKARVTSLKEDLSEEKDASVGYRRELEKAVRENGRLTGEKDRLYSEYRESMASMKKEVEEWRSMYEREKKALEDVSGRVSDMSVRGRQLVKENESLKEQLAKANAQPTYKKAVYHEAGSRRTGMTLQSPRR